MAKSKTEVGTREEPPGIEEPLPIDPETVWEAAKRGYLAYCAHHGSRDPRTGVPMEPWDQRTKHEQDGFYNAALAILTGGPK